MKESLGAHTLVLGSSGFLGRVVTDKLRSRGLILPTHCTTPVFSDSVPFDIFRDSFQNTFAHYPIATVVVCAGFESEAAAQEVERAIDALTAFCADKRLIYLSSDAIFGGDKGDYREDDTPTPRTHYGRNLEVCERRIREHCKDHVIIRPSYIYGFSHGQLDSRLARSRAALEAGETVTLYGDMYKSPLGVVQVAEAVVQLSLSDFSGTIHVAGPRMSVFAFHSEAMRALRVGTEQLEGETMPEDDTLLRDTSLDSNLWQQLRGTLPLSVERTLTQREARKNVI